MLNKNGILQVVKSFGTEERMNEAEFNAMVKEVFELIEDLNFNNEDECRAFLRKFKSFMFNWMWELKA